MKKLSKICAAIIFLLITVNLNAQTPCVNGMAGQYPCMEYDLMSSLSLDQMGISQNGNDCWGWTDPEDGTEYAIMGGNNRTVFIDISDPIAPEILGYLQTASGPSLWRDIKVYNNHAFIVSEADGHGMQVFDLTRLRDVVNPPVAFDTDGYLGGFGSAHNIAMNEETGYAYAIGTSTFDGGPHFINVQDPTNPVSEGGYDGDGYSHDAQIIIYNGPDVEHVGKEIFLGFNENSLTIVDVTEKTDPIIISRTEYEQSAYTHQGWIDDSHTTVYMNDEIDETTFEFNTRTLVMDVTDLDMPSLTHEYFGPTPAIDHNLYIRGDKMFQSNYRSGLRVQQITGDPMSPLEEIGYFDCYPENNETGYSGTWSNYPYFASGNIIISAFDGFYIVKSPTITFTGIEEETESPFGLYPNPVKDVLNVKPIGTDLVDRYVITDVTGRIVMAEQNISASSRNFQIEVKTLTPGTYFISINEEKSAIKFVVE